MQANDANRPIDPRAQPSHAHMFQAYSSDNLGHRHIVAFFTYPVNGNAWDGHVHDYQGHTSTDAGHFHRLIGVTGPAIPLPDGSHYHKVAGSVDDEPFLFEGGSYKTVLSIPRHTHAFHWYTGTGLGYDRRDW